MKIIKKIFQRYRFFPKKTNEIKNHLIKYIIRVGTPRPLRFIFLFSYSLIPQNFTRIVVESIYKKVFPLVGKCEKQVTDYIRNLCSDVHMPDTKNLYPIFVSLKQQNRALPLKTKLPCIKFTLNRV